jgi:PhzF family phenazine biosynthesis protein
MLRPFRQVDVFTDVPYRGNPVAVVLDADGLTTEEMQRVAHWTNLSETTFLLPPSTPDADYRVRIFTPAAELPFAGHPTLGTAHAWLAVGGTPAARADGMIVQECAAGLITIRQGDGGLAFAAPPLVRTGPVEDAVLDEVAAVLGIGREDLVDSQWVDNGPGWVAVLLSSVDQVLALRPDRTDLDIGVVALFPDGAPETIEVRAFFPKDGVTTEDPVTGSLNASLAEWLLRSARVRAPYVASQGTVLGRAGRVHISQDEGPEGTIWVAGGTVTCIAGEIDA